MRFGSMGLADARGAILAHGVNHQGGRFAKGRVISAADIALLQQSGIETIIAAHLDAGDVGEDAAASRIGTRLAGAHLTRSAAFTGRVNLFAAKDGLALTDAATIHALNRVDEAVTIATLAPFTPVSAGQMVATIKIIPFAVPDDIISKLEWMLAGQGPVSVAPWAGLSVSLIQTMLPGTKPSVLDKSARVTADRLAPVGARMVGEQRVAHAVAPLADALCQNSADLILIIGASAITDRRDIIPESIRLAGGSITHLGMPVDPGNLLLLGDLEGRPVLGLPGCARSPKLNGVDWVLQRLGAGLPVTAADIMGMGVGGLLAEVPGRPLPRAAATRIPRAPRVAGLVLAAGFGRRMGAKGNKLLHPLHGQPLLRHGVEAALASQLFSVTIVTGHQAGEIQAALDGLAVEFVHAPDHAAGLSASLKAGLGSLGDDIDGFLVLLGDMPLVAADQIDRLIAAFSPADGRRIIVPVHAGQRGNPVLWDHAFIPEMLAELSGDSGAKRLFDRHGEALCEVGIEDIGVLIDVDTPDALAALNPDYAPVSC